MYRHILVPLDVSNQNERALAVAESLASADRARVTLLHVVEPIEHLCDAELESFYAELSAAALEKLMAAAEKLRDDGCDAAIDNVRGHRAVEIVRYAHDHGCDLIVVATHQIGPETPTGTVGTISHQIAILASCSVLLVREPTSAANS